MKQAIYDESGILHGVAGRPDWAPRGIITECGWMFEDAVPFNTDAIPTCLECLADPVRNLDVPVVPPGADPKKWSWP